MQKRIPQGFALMAVVAIAFAVMSFGGYIDPSSPQAIAQFVLAEGAVAINPEQMAKLENALIKKSSELAENVMKALRDEVEKHKTLSAGTSEKLAEIMTKAKEAAEQVGKAEAEKVAGEVKARLLELEQKGAFKPGGVSDEQKTPGQIFVESAGYKGADLKTAKSIDAAVVGPVHRKTAIINATGQNQPLVPDQRLAFLQPIERRLTIRDLLMQLRTSSNLVQLPKENVFTNNAGLQFNSPNDKENVLKNESGITFTLANTPIETIAHWIPVSRQVLADAPFLQSYIDQRLTYGLKLEEEDQFLNGDGTGGNLSGLLANDTAYNRGVSNDTKLDALLKAMLQVALADMSATGIILNPADWFTIRLLKDTTGRYLFGNPQDGAEPRLWGLPVVATNSMSEGNFQVGAYAMAAAVIDREDVTVRVAEQHDDFAVRNMVAVICEERTAIMVMRSAALVGGTLPIALS